MHLLKNLLTIIIILSIFSCQMRQNGGRSGNGAGDGGGPGGNETGGDIYNYTTITDAESMKFACELYEAQKKRDEWFDTHGLLDSCGYVETTINDNFQNPTISENVNECRSQSTPREPDLTTCDYFGDPGEANRITLHISIKMKLLNKVVILIQNGVITMQPLYDWYSNIKDEDEEKGFFTLSILAPQIGLLVSDKHFVGGIPGMGSDCDGTGTSGNETAGDSNENQIISNRAEVTVNGSKYNWNWPGLTPFRIKEFYNQHTYSIDCATQNAATDSDSKTVVMVKASTFNNFNYPIHVITAQNTEVHPRYNTGCREVSVNFDLHYDQAKDGEFTALDLSNEQLESQCASILNGTQQ